MTLAPSFLAATKSAALGLTRRVVFFAVKVRQSSPKFAKVLWMIKEHSRHGHHHHHGVQGQVGEPLEPLQPRGALKTPSLGN